MLRVFSYGFTNLQDLCRVAAFVTCHVPHRGRVELYSDGTPQITFCSTPGDAVNVAFYLNDNGIKNTCLIPRGLPLENSTFTV